MAILTRAARPLAAAALALAAAPALPYAVVAHAQQAPGARAFPPDSVVSAILKQRVEEKRSAGIVVGLLEPDGRTRIIAYGDPGPGRPPLDGNSVFEIGSITKTFTATVLAELVLDGEVSLDDPVQKYLPASVHVPSRGGKEITLVNLSEQNSGLPRMPSNFAPKDTSNPYADYTAQQMYDFLSRYQLTRDPGAEFEYSNLGVGLLGHALTRATGQSYADMVRTHVIEPLHMEHTAVAFTPWMTQHLAVGHDEQGRVAANWDLGALAGAGAIRSTTEDMLKYLDANLHTERGPLGRAMAFAHERRASAGALGDIGLNWIRTRVGNDTVVWHNGGTGGYRTFIGFNPATKMGVVLMTNTGGTGADDIAMHLLEPIVPLAPKPQPVKQRTAIELPASVLARYVGTYQVAPTFALVVTLEGDALFAQPTGQPKIRLWPESETEFFFKAVDAQITFARDAQGVVTGLVLHQNGANVPGRKVN